MRWHGGSRAAAFQPRPQKTPTQLQALLGNHQGFPWPEGIPRRLTLDGCGKNHQWRMSGVRPVPPLQETTRICLVGGSEHFLFSHILGTIIPIDVHIFQRGGPTTNQMCSIKSSIFWGALSASHVWWCSEIPWKQGKKTNPPGGR